MSQIYEFWLLSIQHLGDGLGKNYVYVLWLHSSALHIEKCSHVTIKKSTFKHNEGVGLSIYDPLDEINIEECQFQENQILTEFDSHPGGGGLHIELTTCPPGIYSRDRSIYCTPSHEMDQSKHIQW